MRKRLIAAGCCLLLVLSGAVSILASENGRFLEGCREEGGQLSIFCADIVPGEERIDDFKISLGGQEMETISLEWENEIHTPITYYCLVDVSGSMNEEQMSQTKETLSAIADGLLDGDNMVIGTLGNQTDAGGYLTEPEEIKEAIEALAAGGEDTNLYQGICESIRILESDAGVNPRKCLLILSDGKDDQKTGITKGEAEKAVAEASIPVYTVAVLREAPDEEAIDNAKLLGSFARMSAGGAHFAPKLDGITAAEAGTAILSQRESGFVVTVKLPDMLPDKDEMLLRMVYTSAEGAVYEDTLKLYAEDLTGVFQSEEQEADTEERLPQPEPSLPEPSSSLSPWLVGGIAAAVLLVLAVLTAVRLRKRKRKENPDGRKGEPEENSAAVTVEASGEAASVPGTKVRSVRVLELRLYAIGYSGIGHTLRLEEGKEVTVGRNGKADIILDPKDSKLSGVHCKMKWENGKVYIRDMDSKNGTFVNGIPIRAIGRVAVHTGETIRMGSYEYRVEERGGAV